MSEADERRYAYEAQQRSPKPEPTFEYRVVCADGEERARQRVLGCGEAEVLRESVEALPWPRCPCGKFAHSIERRSVGPWEPA